MLNFVPNIVVLNYLTAVNQLTSNIEEKAKSFLATGYQTELTYKHDDGSYSAFGKSDSSGTTWLTAFVAKSFHQASKYIEIDQEIINNALNFLSKVQKRDGSFPEVGYMLSKSMQGGASKGIALTAYTLVTFLENDKHSDKYKMTTKKALDFINKNLQNIEDNYSLAITAYAQQLARPGSRLLPKLLQNAIRKDGMMYWKEGSDSETKPVDIEMTAYALQALIKANKITEAVAVMKWMTTQRNKNGGFISTQDTVVGLQALAELAAKIHSSNFDIEITLRDQTSFRLNNDNALVTQKYELAPEMRSFEVTARGRGFAMFQIAYKYNMETADEVPRFTLEPKVHENSNKDFLHLVVCTSLISQKPGEKSNMAVMEVNLPSGYIFDDPDALAELKTTEKVKVRT
jgi:CD109 antigen